MGDSIPRGPFDHGLFLSHFNKGRDLFEARRFDEAERQLEEAYLLRPREARVLNLLGLVYFRGNKLVKAEEVYRKLVAENPEAPTLHYNLGLICFKLNRLEEAEQAFNKALELTHGNPKIHFYLGSIFERQHRHKDAIYQYRQAGAHLMVQRLQGRLDSADDGPIEDADGPTASPSQPEAPAAAPAGAGSPRSGDSTAPPGLLAPPPRPEIVPTALPSADDSVPALAGPEKVLQPVSPTLLAVEKPQRPTTERFRQEDTLPPLVRASAGATPPAALSPPEGEPAPTREVFRGLERGLMEVDFAGKVFIKQGTIYSYTGNLTFWVKEPRQEPRAPLVIVTGTGRLLLTDHDREITFMRVSEEQAILVEPAHLLACEESLQPRYLRLAEGPPPLELVVLEGRGMVAMSVASKPLPLTVKPGVPVCVPAASVIMWAGELTAHVVDDPQVYAVVAPSAAGGGRLLRLEGQGRVLVEQTAG